MIFFFQSVGNVKIQIEIVVLVRYSVTSYADVIIFEIDTLKGK